MPTFAVTSAQVDWSHNSHKNMQQQSDRTSKAHIIQASLFPTSLKRSMTSHNLRGCAFNPNTDQFHSQIHTESLRFEKLTLNSNDQQDVRPDDYDRVFADLYTEEEEETEMLNELYSLAEEEIAEEEIASKKLEAEEARQDALIRDYYDSAPYEDAMTMEEG